MIKIAGNVVGGLLILIGALFIIGSGGSQGGGFGWIFTGIVLVGVGIVLLWVASRRPKTDPNANVTYKVDLSGDVNLESLKCKSCGGTLSADNVKMVAGAPMVSCPFCGSTYQLTEEPKW